MGHLSAGPPPGVLSGGGPSPPMPPAMRITLSLTALVVTAWMLAGLAAPVAKNAGRTDGSARAKGALAGLAVGSAAGVDAR